MTFPVYLNLFGHRIHSHLAFEMLAYGGGFQLYLGLRRRQAASRRVPFEQNLWLIVGCIFGALIGSKLLAWIESAPDYWAHRLDPRVWIGGKTIVGGLLGGWVGVEIVKKKFGIRRSTGDLFVYPLIFGQCVGRVGCFLTGLEDHTYGNLTNLAWGVDFGDGPRHPTQLYEIGYLVLLGASIWVYERVGGRLRGGARFRLYMLGYLLFRFGCEFIKPVFAPYVGLSAIQLAALVGAFICLTQLLTGHGLDSEVKEEIPQAVEVTA